MLSLFSLIPYGNHTKSLFVHFRNPLASENVLSLFSLIPYGLVGTMNGSSCVTEGKKKHIKNHSCEIHGSLFYSNVLYPPSFVESVEIAALLRELVVNSCCVSKTTLNG